MNVKKISCLLLQSAALIALTACSDKQSSSGVTDVDLSFSDAAVDNVSEVVVTVERITFQRNGDESAEDIVVETFAADEDGGDTETFTLDLMTVQGDDKMLVVDSVKLPIGEYSNMLIEVATDVEGPNLPNYVTTDTGGTKELKVPSDILKLGAFSIEPTSTQSMVVEFGLQQSMTYNPGPDRYILKPRGVRIISVDQAALVTGAVNHALLQDNDACVALENGGTAGNVYLYSGHEFEAAKLADNFDAEVATEAEGLIAPIASASLMSDTFSLSYLEGGKYTLAVSCNEASDDADELEQPTVPNPSDQIIEFSIEVGQTLTCAIPLTDAGCVDEAVGTETEN